jgi:alkylation response protein AidB-like acyl-CoA dehydrogenase
LDLTPPPLQGFADNCLSHAGQVAEQLDAFLDANQANIEGVDALYRVFNLLVQSEFSELPMPAAGATLARFAALATVAKRSLPLVKLYEAHSDAHAIIKELGAKPKRGASYGVFAAENPAAPLIAREGDDGQFTLNGVKSWCSGASCLSHALVTARDQHGDSLLLSVALGQRLVTPSKSDWKAVGMALTETSSLTFHDAPAALVGAPDSYLSRAGFWHGAIGIAACWYGAACALAEELQRSLARRHEAHGLAHLGAAATQLQAARSALQHAAQALDADATHDARALALATRAIVEAAAQSVLEHAGRALGARPYCMDARFAAMAADLPVFLRQSHAERDLEALGQQVLSFEPSWMQLHNRL